METLLQSRLFHILISAFAILVTLQCVSAHANNAKILVIPKGTRVQHWQWVKQGALQAGKDRGIEVIFRGPRVSDNHSAQRKIIQSGIDSGMDAIVIAPTHPTFAVPELTKAVAKGIKVIVIDTPMEFDLATTFIASDNYLAGVQAANHLMGLLHKKGTILVVRYQQDHASTHARETGFLSTITNSQGDFTIVDAGYAGLSVREAFRITKEALHKTPSIHAVFTPGEFTTLGAIEAIGAVRPFDRPILIGFDYTSKLHQAILKGTLKATVLQKPYAMGYLAVTSACDALEGKPVKPRIKTGTTVLTSQNISHFDFLKQSAPNKQ